MHTGFFDSKLYRFFARDMLDRHFQHTQRLPLEVYGFLAMRSDICRRVLACKFFYRDSFLIIALITRICPKAITLLK